VLEIEDEVGLSIIKDNVTAANVVCVHVKTSYFAKKSGAHDQDRTGDLALTKGVLCRLSYVGGIAGSILHESMLVNSKKQTTSSNRHKL